MNRCPGCGLWTRTDSLCQIPGTSPSFLLMVFSYLAIERERIRTRTVPLISYHSIDLTVCKEKELIHFSVAACPLFFSERHERVRKRKSSAAELESCSHRLEYESCCVSVACRLDALLFTFIFSPFATVFRAGESTGRK